MEEKICLEDKFQKSYYDELTGIYHMVAENGTEKSFSVSETLNISKIQVEVISVLENKMRFRLLEKKLSDYEGIRFHLWQHKNGKKVFYQNVWPVENSDSEFEIDMTKIVSYIEEDRNITLRGMLEVCENGSLQLYRMSHQALISKLDKKLPKGNLEMYDPVAKIEMKDGIHIAVPYYSKETDFNVYLCREADIMNRMIGCQLTKLKIRGGKAKLQFIIENTEKYKISRIEFVYRNKRESDADQYDMPFTKVEDGKYIRVSTELDLQNVEWKMMYWDFFVWFEMDGKEYKRGISASKAWLRKFQLLFVNPTYTVGENIAYPYLTLGTKIAFQFRKRGEYDGIGFKFKERVAFVLYMLRKRGLAKRNIYLVYEKFCVMAQDNGYYFFKYCMENNAEKDLNGEIYYIIDKDSPDREKLAAYEDHLIDFMSFKHIIYLLAAKLLISTDTRNHSYAWRKRGSILMGKINRKKIVFLQHGVTAFKRVDFLYGKGRTGDCNAFVVTSDYEREIVEQHFDYPPEEIAVTGFARWDVLEDKSEGKREILLMPTWRNWLEEVDDETFKKSDYYVNYMNFLNSERLSEILDQYDLTLNFYIHPKFRDYIKDFKIKAADRINLIPFGTVPLNELMMTCKMLITDYSSVAWDVYYQSKPVLFYHFDLDDYNETHGSYMDIRNDIFGDRVEHEEDLIELIDQYAETGFQLKPEFREKINYYFKYIDNDNSKRICDHITKMKGL